MGIMTSAFWTSERSIFLNAVALRKLSENCLSWNRRFTNHEIMSMSGGLTQVKRRVFFSKWVYQESRPFFIWCGPRSTYIKMRSTSLWNSATLWSLCRTLTCHHWGGQSGTVLEQIVQSWLQHTTLQEPTNWSCFVVPVCLNGVDLTAGPRATCTSKKLSCCPWQLPGFNKDPLSKSLCMTFWTATPQQPCRWA